jgi:hypothetical protein
MIRAIAATGQYSDPAAAKLLADVLIERRDRIGQAYLNAVNPVIGVALAADGTLTFENAAVALGVGSEPAGGYLVDWAAFDNATGQATPLGERAVTTDRRVKAPGSLPSTPGAFVQVRIAAANAQSPAWALPIEVHFRRTAAGWTLVGLNRMPQP